MNPTTMRPRLLLVDDDVVLRGMATQTLRHAGFDVTSADCGEEGLRLFECSDFDLVLLDVMMPGLDGFEICNHLRATPRGATLPVLILTGLNDTESIEGAFQCGATDFVTKPINWTLLGHRVRYSLRASAVAETAIRTTEQLAMAQRLASLGSWEWSPASGELVCSQEMLRILGREGPSGQNVTATTLLDQVCEADRNIVRRARDAVANGGTPYELKFSLARTDGQKRVVYEQAGAWRNAAGQVEKVAAVTQDITDRVEAERRIHQLAFRDDLTGLPNRQFFVDMAAAAIERSRRLRSVCAVLHIDLDRFKGINDVLGHEGGDSLLRTMTDRLQTCIRRSDLVSADRGGATTEVIARVGANAFTILLVDIASDKLAGLVCERLLRAISQPLSLGTHELVVTASAGIALFPRDADEVQGLVQKAEQAMYTAKAAGRAQRRFFNEEMNRAATMRVALEQELRRAIGTGELCLFFQPKVNATSGEITGAEALVRWRHPRRGLMLPGDFIPLAEESGLIVPVGDWVLKTACEALQRWGKSGVNTVPFSINLASPSFEQGDLVERLDGVVQRCGIEARQLTFEITESMLMKDLDRTVAHLRALKRKGFGLSLDDFGTGFSSLSYLTQLPIDELKLDRSFVHDLTEGGRHAAIAGSIIALSRQFGLEVVAEGVETEEQAALLVDLGCPIQQGFLYARPMPAEEFGKLLTESTTLTRKPARCS